MNIIYLELVCFGLMYSVLVVLLDLNFLIPSLNNPI